MKLIDNFVPGTLWVTTKGVVIMASPFGEEIHLYNRNGEGRIALFSHEGEEVRLLSSEEALKASVQIASIASQSVEV